MDQGGWEITKTGGKTQEDIFYTLKENTTTDKCGKITRKVLLDGIDLGKIAHQIIIEEMTRIRMEGSKK